jgi:hypothetical protein
VSCEALRHFTLLEVGLREALTTTLKCRNNHRRWQKFAILAGRHTGRCARLLSIYEIGLEDTRSTELNYL